MSPVEFFSDAGSVPQVWTHPNLHWDDFTQVISYWHGAFSYSHKVWGWPSSSVSAVPSPGSLEVRVAFLCPPFQCATSPQSLVIYLSCVVWYTPSHTAANGFLSWTWISLYRWPSWDPESWRSWLNLSPPVNPRGQTRHRILSILFWVFHFPLNSLLSRDRYWDFFPPKVLFGFINSYWDLLLVQAASHSPWPMTLQSRADVDPLT